MQAKDTQEFISGSGGKDNNSPPYNAADNLDSVSIAKIVDVITEGEIAGFATPYESQLTDLTSNEYKENAKKDIFFNKIPVIRKDGYLGSEDQIAAQWYNFDRQHLKLNSNLGTENQDSLNIIRKVRTEVSVPNGSTNINFGVNNARTSGQFTDESSNRLDAVAVTINFPAMVRLENDGDAKGIKTSYKITVITTIGSDTSIQTVEDSVEGRTNDLYQKQHVIDIFTTSTASRTIEIKVERTTTENRYSDTIQIEEAMQFISYTKIINDALTYPNTALVGLEANATEFQSVPKRTYKIKGIKIRIPGTGADGSTPTVDRITGRIIYDSNYIFNGTMQTATFCSCPVFVLYDILTSKRYGFGEQVLSEKEKNDFSNGNAENIDLYSFVSASKYCNELVSNRRVTPKQQTGTITKQVGPIITITKNTPSGENPSDHYLQVGDRISLNNGDNLSINNIEVLSTNKNNNYYFTVNQGSEITTLNSTVTITIESYGNLNEGSTEPRFSFNGVINKREEAFSLINKICSNFRGFAYWAEGKIKISLDKPSDSIYLFGRSNVTPEGFTYEGSDISTRSNLVIVRYFNNNLQQTDYVQHPISANISTDPYISRYGTTKKQIEAYGCTSRGQASRLARWIYFSENLLTETVTFKTTADAGTVVRPGMIISISDPVRSGSRYGGRITNVNNTSANNGPTITVDDLPNITVDSTNDKLIILLPNGTTEEKSVVSISNGKEIKVSGIFSTTPQNNSIWIYERITVAPTKWRVLSISEESNLEYKVTALQYNESIYGKVESDNDIIARDITDLDESPSAPTSITVQENLYRKIPRPGYASNNNTIKSEIGVLVRFSWPGSASINRYKVIYRIGSNADSLNNEIVSSVTTNEFELRDINSNSFIEFNVFSINQAGRISSSGATQTYQVIGKNYPPSDLTSLTTTVDPNIGIKLSWSPIVPVAPKFADLDVVGYEIRKKTSNVAPDVAVVDGSAYANYITNEEWTNAGTEGKVFKGDVTDFIIPVDDISSTTYFFVKAYDSSGFESEYARYIEQTISAPNTITNVITSQADSDLIISWTAPSTGTYALKHYKVQINEEEGTEFYVETTKLQTSLSWTGARIFKITPIDIVGNLGTTKEVTVNIVNPLAPTNLTASYTSDSLILKWTASANNSSGIEKPLKGYRIYRGTENVLGQINGTEFKIKVNIDNLNFGSNFDPTTDEVLFRVVPVVVDPDFPTDGYPINDSDATILVDFTNASAPSLQSPSYEFELDFIRLKWNTVQGTLPTVAYEVLHEVEGIDVSLGTVKGTEFITKWPNDNNTEKYKIRALSNAYYDEINSSVKEKFTGAKVTINATRVALNKPTITGLGYEIKTNVENKKDTLIELSWLEAATIDGTLGFKDFHIKRVEEGGTWDSTADIDIFQASDSYQERVSWTGRKDYLIKSRDLLDNESTDYVTIQVEVQALGVVQNLRSEVIDNHVQIFWEAPSTGTLSVEHYILKKGGDSFDDTNAVFLANKQSPFASFFEKFGGIKTYRIAPYDTAGNKGAASFITATVADPPDFILKADLNSELAGPDVPSWIYDLSNVLQTKDTEDNDVLVMPVNLTETWAEHFTNNSKTTFQGFIDAGFPRYLMPTTGQSSNSGIAEYSEIYDYGANITGTKITSTIGGTDLSGSGEAIVLKPKINFRACSSISSAVSGTYIQSVDGYTNNSSTPGDIIKMIFTGNHPNLINGLVVTLTFDGPSSGLKSPSGNYKLIAVMQGSGYKTCFVKTEPGNNFYIVGDTSGDVKIQYCETWGDWTEQTYDVTGDTRQIYGTNFRQVKFYWRAESDNGKDLYEASEMNLRLDSKNKSDAGTGEVTNANNGATVSFNESFLSVTAIVVTPKATTFLTPVIDFNESLANPTNFTVYLYNQSGNKVTGNFFWEARGA